jgi:hypothetical protein
MHLSLGGIVKGIETGLTTLAETGNPYIAAGAGVVSCVTDNGNGGGTNGAAANANVQTFNPLLDSMSAELNQGSTSNVYSYAQLAGLDANGNSTQSDPYGGVTDADLVD